MKYYNEGKSISFNEYNRLKDLGMLNEDTIYIVDRPSVTLEERVSTLEDKIKELGKAIAFKEKNE